MNTGERLNDEPFILASQASQVYYVKDPRDKGWLVAVRTKARDVFDVGNGEREEDDGDTYYDNEPYELIIEDIDTDGNILDWSRNDATGSTVQEGASGTRDQASPQIEYDIVIITRDFATLAAAFAATVMLFFLKRCCFLDRNSIVMLLLLVVVAFATYVAAVFTIFLLLVFEEKLHYILRDGELKVICVTTGNCQWKVSICDGKLAHWSMNRFVEDHYIAPPDFLFLGSRPMGKYEE
ncbi:hypothetical protein Vadar_002528 [Vaccinium darrowii]|uniref:Uncharacterized protein n=1 Tax=Vaccinium darrowii TaxID=229202 RepID=A0ACB7YB21_9ERIC|nr:hypothetical protein Vadar_002528 [Vaccinium darrowii]